MRRMPTNRRSSAAAPRTSSIPTCSRAFTAITSSPQSSAAGLDPENLAAGSLDTMKFGSEGSDKSRAWRDIWGSGQGIGVIDQVRPAADYVDLLAAQYAAAKARLLGS